MPVTNLPSVQQEMIRYGVTTYLVVGLAGNICNCIMFTHHSHRRTASSIYFLALSIFAIIYLMWSAAPLIYTLNYTDVQTQSVFYCKIRMYISHCLGQCLRCFIVLVCADRFFATRTNIRIRSLSSIPMAKKFVFIISAVCFLVAIHLPILIDIRDSVCGIVGLYKLIYAVYQIILVTIIPPVLMIIFSVLTVRNLHQQHDTQRQARKRDRYLMRMVIAEVIANIFTSIPYSVNLVYGAVTYYVMNKSPQRLEIEAFATFVTQFLIYFLSVVPFYLFLLTSKPFRKRFITIIVKYCKKCMTGQVRIVPLQGQNNATIINRTVIFNRQ